MFLPGMAAGRLVDRGYHRGPLAVASTILVAVTFILGDCNKYWQLLLLQGIVTGVSFFHTI